MKLLVTVPSTGALQAAGTRIRYRRLQRAMAERGACLEIAPIEQLDSPGATTAVDAVLISKVMDGRALVLARSLRRRGVRVGIDLFDDYFSQPRLSGTQPQRRWLRQLADQLDFALCSTAALAGVLRGALPGVPLHELRDCHAGRLKDLDALAAALQRRWQRLATSGDLPVTWFGMGDHPLFDVGLADLAQQADQLNRLQDSGLRVKLNLLTNERALTAAGLRLIRQLPVHTQLEIWSVERERTMLDSSVLAFLPVADTPFSRAKSPNRAITALEHGCQVLTTATPVYSAFADFVYTDAASLLTDLERGRPRLRPKTLATLRRQLQLDAHPPREAERLCSFLEGIPAPSTAWASPAVASPPICVIQGLRPALSPSSAPGQPVLLVRCPLSAAEPGDDLRVIADRSGEPLLRLSPALWRALPEAQRARLEPAASAAGPGADGLDLPLAALGPLEPRLRLALRRALASHTFSEKLTLRPMVIALTRGIVGRLLPDSPQLLNEELPG